jgi:hypothetical protein
MSSDAVNYCQVACKCPHGHLLGTIMKTWSSICWCAERPLSNSKKKIDGEPMTVGEKVEADCAECRKEGRYGTNYQASWKRVAAKLAEARDTRFGQVTLIFG